MKKLILFAFTAMFLMSCGGAGQQPDDYITFGQAFNHVSKSFWYWFFIVVAILPPVVYIAAYYMGKIDEVDLRLLFALLAVLLFAIFFRPCEVAANTTVAQAARGNYIGY